MKTKIMKYVVITTVFIMLHSIAFAQPLWLNESNSEMAEAFMADEDGNGDGKVTQAEFKGSDSDFALFDSNGDGIIELFEAPTHDTLPAGFGAVATSSVAVIDSSIKQMDKVTINGIEFKFEQRYAFFGWDHLPSDLKIERMPIQRFTSAAGYTHYYELVYLPDGNLNWYQAAYLAADAGGYLASPTSAEENNFLFAQVDDPKYFWRFPAGSGQMNHYGISIGPFLGGYQPEGSQEPAGGWIWLSGEKMTYTNWAVNLDDGVIDKDPRPNDQPNDSGGHNQRVMGFGEMNLPVATWGDYMDAVGTYGRERLPGRSYAFIIEYETLPWDRDL
jgi:hypothetical protein